MNRKERYDEAMLVVGRQLPTMAAPQIREYVEELQRERDAAEEALNQLGVKYGEELARKPEARGAARP
jgi:hypothetical protein